MRRAGGQVTYTNRDGSIEEMDTFTCGHGNEIVKVRPGQDPTTAGGFCRMCMKHICDRCAATGTCAPFERKLEEMESKARFHRAVGV